MLSQESRAFGIAGLAGFDQFLGFTESRSVNEDDVLLFGSWVEEVTRHGE